MKKILACFALFAALIFVTSCGSSSKTDNKNDNTDTGETTTDNDTGDIGSTDTEPGGGDTEPTENPDSDNPDTTPDAGDSDSTPDNDADSGDSAPDSDNEEPVNENPDNLPECSPTSSTPCFDHETGLIWSGKAQERIRWIDAVDYCKNLKEGGYDEWRLPSVAVLRTLVKQCESSGYSDGECSKFGDIAFFWSSSSQGNGVFFYDGATQTKNVDENFDARCVRREGSETRQANCVGPEHSEWNTVPEITQTWDWNKKTWDEEQMWTPSSNGKYDEESSTSECRFKCEENYFWNNSERKCVSPTDPDTGLTWSAKAQKAMKWNAAVTYCDNLEEGGYDDWRLPTIDELKTLLIWSKANSCKVSETNNCLAWDGCWTCETCTEQGTASPSDNTCSNLGNSYSDGRYSKFGEDGWFWSSSTKSDGTGYAWYVDFDGGYVNGYDKATNDGLYVRCVR